MPLLSTLGAASAQAFGAGARQTAANYIEDVFSTYLYTGNDSTQTITNGINLSGKGGLVWLKNRTGAATGNVLTDTVRGANKILYSNTTDAEINGAWGVNSFNSNGFTLIQADTYNNNSSYNYASWTFRKQPKFFDVVTYNGNSVSGTTINHNLGSVPGMIIIKCISGTLASNQQWFVYHRSINATNPEQYVLYLNTSDARMYEPDAWNSTAPTSTTFTLGNKVQCNASGYTYVAYLFAHDAGGFGVDGSQNVISCGSYTGNGSATGPSITLGWEPQFILVKSSTAAYDWTIFDNMRGISTGGVDARLFPNLSSAESLLDRISLTPTGFNLTSANAAVNENGTTFIYLAIRRGPMKVPTDATTVFQPIAITPSSGTISTTGFATDAMWLTYIAGTDTRRMFDKLRGIGVQSPPPYERLLRTNTTDDEIDSTPVTYNWWNTGYTWSGSYAGLSTISYAFLRAPSFFDVVCYTGTGVARTINHNLGVTPELMFVKNRDSGQEGWNVQTAYSRYGYSGLLRLNSNSADYNASNYFTTPTATTFGIGTSNPNDGGNNRSGDRFVSYLFASCPGVSKVGSYTGTGATQTISCGFTGGARYVLIKRTDNIGDWWVWDKARGMVAGTDPRLTYNSNAAETNANWVYTTTGGFQIVTSDATINASGGSYIYLAIA